MVTYNTVTITGQDIYGNNDGEPVVVTLTPNFTVYFDVTNNIAIAPQPLTTNSANDGTWSIAGVIDPTSAGSGLAWKLVIQDKSTNTTIYSQVVQVAYASGASQGFLALPPAVSNPITVGAMPLPSGTAVQGMTAVATGNGSASSWSFPAVTTVTGNYNVGAGDGTVRVNAGSTATVTLPTAVGITGRIIRVKNLTTNTVTVNTTSSQTMDGAATKTLSQYSIIDVQSNGTNWDILHITSGV